MTFTALPGAGCSMSESAVFPRGSAPPTRRVCFCCACCQRVVSSAGMPHALPTTAMLRTQSSASSLLPFSYRWAMASFANCSCSTLAFSIVILNPPSVFWALPVSTQWHIHSECLSSNTNKKARSNSTFCRGKKEPLSRKILGKTAQNAVGKGEPLPVKRTVKKYKVFPVSSRSLLAVFYAARQRACFSIGVRTPRLR